jgi:hypothetical protein
MWQDISRSGVLINIKTAKRNERNGIAMPAAACKVQFFWHKIKRKTYEGLQFYRHFPSFSPNLIGTFST